MPKAIEPIAPNTDPSIAELAEAFTAGMEGRKYTPENIVRSQSNKADTDSDSESTSGYLRNNLPRAYADTRSVGDPITKEQLTEVLGFAKTYNVQIGVVGNTTGGFETYCGDVGVLKNLILEVEKQEASELYKQSGAPKPILMYDNVLGYHGDNSKVDVDAFAVTNGKTITLNKFMFDDSDYMNKEYNESVDAGHFVKNTDYRSVIAHEMGHIIDKSNPRLKRRILYLLQIEAEKEGLSQLDYVLDNISKYASKMDADGNYVELLAEINSMLHCKENNAIIQMLRRGGVL